jgi:folylpolyglutamate synthase/dihydropteroate synthase
MNASLALSIVEAFLDAKGLSGARSLTNADIETGVRRRSWSGLFQIIPNHWCTCFLDAAHNDMSVKIAPDWFAEVAAELDESATRVLVFRHISELRDAMTLLRNLAGALKNTDIELPHIVFATYDTFQTPEAHRRRRSMHSTGFGVRSFPIPLCGTKNCAGRHWACKEALNRVFEKYACAGDRQSASGCAGGSNCSRQMK